MHPVVEPAVSCWPSLSNKKKTKHQKGLDRAIANVSSTLKHVSSQQAAHNII